MIQKRFVAMLDIAGFKKIVENEPTEKVYDLMKKVQVQVAHYEYIKDSINLDIITFSDSIVIASKDGSKESFEDIILASSQFEGLFFDNGYAINGTIAYGEIVFDKESNIIFGMPLNEAHTEQENLFFYGITLHTSAVKQIEDYKYNIFLSPPIFSDTIFELNVPLKNKGWVKKHCINWWELRLIQQPFEDQIKWLKECLTKLYNNTSHEIRGIYYIMNTELVLKQWFDFTNSTLRWEQPLFEQNIIKFPTEIIES